MRCKIFKRSDGHAIVQIPSKKYQDKKLWSQCPVPKNLSELPHIDVRCKELQSLLKSNEATIDQLYFSGKKIGFTNLKVDDKWKAKLMSPSIIKSKYIARLEDDLDDELSKNKVNGTKLAKLIAEKDRCRSWTDLQWYQKAVTLISRKPEIKKSLEDKIEQLENATTNI